MSDYRGDITPGKVLYFRFSTAGPTGAGATLSGSPVISAYKNGSLTQSTTGITLTVDYDGVTGLNSVAVDTSADGSFYAAASEIDLVITTGTVNSVSVAGQPVGSFSISNRSGLRPTTADRTLDVSLTGEAGLDWANVGSPTTTVGLSGTTVKTATDVETDTQDIQSRLPAALTSGGNIKAGVQGFLDAVFTEGAAGRIAAAFKQFFNIATPAATMDHGILVDVVTDLTNGGGGGGTGLTAAETRAALGMASANMDTQLASLATVPLTAAATRSALGLASANLDTQLASLFTTAMTESYGSDGSTVTPAQALYIIMQRLNEFSIAGTLITVKKLNGSTTAFTLTLDDGSSPTSSTRST